MGPPLFVHVPRTGGSSIRAVLGLERSHEIHLPLWEWARRVDLAERRPFAFVRNPWDRALSIFRFLWRRHPERITPDGFRDWLRGGMLHPSGARPTLYAGTPYAIDVTAPQAAWLRVDGTVPLPAPWIGRYESLEDDFRQLCQRFDLQAKLPHENAAPRGDAPVEAYFAPETVERLAELYREDIECFHYGPPSPSSQTGVSA